MNTYYQIKRLLKIAEVDSYEEGCDPDTTQMTDVDLYFKGTSPDDVIHRCAEYLGVDKDSIEKNVCDDDDGRIDFSLMECDDSTVPNKNEIARWKKGQLRLWDVTYSGYVEKVTIERL